MEFVPYLAKEFSFSDDGLEWTFKLRDDVYFHHGKQFNADDVLLTYAAMLHPKYEGSRTSSFIQLKGAKDYLSARKELEEKLAEELISQEEYDAQALELFEEWLAGGAIEVVNDFEIIFRLSEPSAPFMARMRYGILPSDLLTLEEAGDMECSLHTENPSGTGPFKFEEWVRDDHVTLVRNEDYWREGPYLEKIIFQIIPDQDTQAMALEAGDLDYAGVTYQEFDRFASMEHLNAYSNPGMTYGYWGLNLLNPLFQDLRVRQALAHSLDRETMCKELFYGHADVAHSHHSTSRWDYNPDVPKYDYDVDRAKELLTEAGWVDSDGDGIREKDGQKLAFTLVTQQGNKWREQCAVIIQDKTKDIGVQVEPQLLEWSTLVSNLLGKNFETVIIGWSLGVDPDPTGIWHSVEAGNMNFVSYANPRVDQLIEEGRTTLDQAKRKAIYCEFQEILAQDVPYVFLFTYNTCVALHSRFQGPISAHPLGLTRNIELWHVPEELQLTR